MFSFISGVSFLLALAGKYMKIFVALLLFIVAGSYYLKANASIFNNDVEVKTYSDIYFKLESSPVSLAEVITGAKEFALNICEDDVYQQALGKSTESCRIRFHETQVYCSKYILAKGQQYYTTRDEVSLLSEKFISCVSG